MRPLHRGSGQNPIMWLDTDRRTSCGSSVTRRSTLYVRTWQSGRAAADIGRSDPGAHHRRTRTAGRSDRGGYVLPISEADWHEHRMFKGPDTNMNLLGLHGPKAGDRAHAPVWTYSIRAARSRVART